MSLSFNKKKNHHNTICTLVVFIMRYPEFSTSNETSSYYYLSISTIALYSLYLSTYRLLLNNIHVWYSHKRPYKELYQHEKLTKESDNSLRKIENQL